MNIDKVKKILKEYVILEKMKDDFDVEPAKRQDVEVFVKRHYLQKFPSGIKRIYAIHRKQTEGRQMVGMIIYGSPFHTTTHFLEPEVKHSEVIELKRLYIDDIGVKNLESFFIGQSLNLLRKDEPSVKVVVTFADDKHGHVGGIYQATNAIYLGKSEGGKHKYIYILNGNVNVIRNRVQSLVKAYPKKEIPPITETQGSIHDLLGISPTKQPKRKFSHAEKMLGVEDVYNQPETFWAGLRYNLVKAIKSAATLGIGVSAILGNEVIENYGEKLNKVKEKGYKLTPTQDAFLKTYQSVKR